MVTWNRARVLQWCLYWTNWIAQTNIFHSAFYYNVFFLIPIKKNRKIEQLFFLSFIVHVFNFFLSCECVFFWSNWISWSIHLLCSCGIFKMIVFFLFDERCKIIIFLSTWTRFEVVLSSDNDNHWAISSANTQSSTNSCIRHYPTHTNHHPHAHVCFCFNKFCRCYCWWWKIHADSAIMSENIADWRQLEFCEYRWELHWNEWIFFLLLFCWPLQTYVRTMRTNKTCNKQEDTRKNTQRQKYWCFSKRHIGWTKKKPHRKTKITSVARIFFVLFFFFGAINLFAAKTYVLVLLNTEREKKSSNNSKSWTFQNNANAIHKSHHNEKSYKYRNHFPTHTQHIQSTNISFLMGTHTRHETSFLCKFVY